MVTTISSSRAVNGTGGVICVYKYIACIAPSINFGHLNLLVERYERGIPLSNVRLGFASTRSRDVDPKNSICSSFLKFFCALNI